MPSPRRGTSVGHTDIGRNAPHDAEDAKRETSRLWRQLLQRISFGDPQGGDTNGVLVNMEGSWVNVELTDPAAPFVCTHNLDTAYDAAKTRPNVRWLVWGWEHDGTGAGAGDGVQVSYQYGDAISANSITLRPHVAGGRTVSGAHPLRLTLWFHRVSQTS